MQERPPRSPSTNLAMNSPQPQARRNFNTGNGGTSSRHTGDASNSPLPNYSNNARSYSNNSAQRSQSIPSSQRSFSPRLGESPYKTKNSYNEKKEFYEIFMNLIELEQKEDLRGIYNNETGLKFINNNDFDILIDYSSLINFKVAKIFKDLKTELNFIESTRRVAIFADYYRKINQMNKKNIIVESNNGDILQVKIYLALHFCLFVFNESVPENVIRFNIKVGATNDFKSIKSGMIDFLDWDLDPDITSVFLGLKTEAYLDLNIEVDDYSVNGLFQLNHSQIEAVRKALNYKVSIIQAPPDTGKYRTISSIVYHIDKLCRPHSEESIIYFRNRNGNNPFGDLSVMGDHFSGTSKILVCAASNNQVFELRRKLADKGLKVLHILAKTIEDTHKNDKGTLKYNFDLRAKTDNDLNELKLKLKNLKSTDPRSPEIHRLQQKIKMTEECIKISVVKEYDIICCTLTILQTFIFKQILFDFVIVDDAHHILEPNIALCLLNEVRHLVLVGDIHQLGPYVKSQRAIKLGFEVTTIERLQGLGVPSTFLDTQYNKQLFLSELSSENFYNDKIKNVIARASPIRFPNIVKTHGFFYHIKSLEEQGLTGFLNTNKNEAEAVLNVFDYLIRANIGRNNIGVFTFYAAQKQYLKDQARRYHIEGIEVFSVDESQGMEKDYIILSCVRSNSFKKFGFLENYKRFNTAITRAKIGLVVCGNADFFVGSEHLKKLILYFQMKNAIFTGNFENMIKHTVKIQVAPPRINIEENKNNRSPRYS